ncbi:MAG: methyl-accepting chemotaxis protein [Candidatus Kapabacteria bacterium]|nr:methyl-accepting chemotaxis protein [Candidatus Kapabacteria bacterium]
MFKNMKLSVKLITSFMIVCIITAALGILSVTELRQADDSDTIMYENNTKPLAILIDITVSFQEMRVKMRDVIFESTKEKREKAKEAYKRAFDTIEKDIPLVKERIRHDDQKRDLEIFAENVKKYFELSPKVFELAIDNKRDEAFEALLSGRVFTDPAKIALDDLSEKTAKYASDRSEENSATANANIRTMWIIIILAVVIAFGLGFFITRNIQGQLGGDPIYVMEITGKVADGDLSMKIDLNKKKPNSLIVKMDTMVKTIQGLVNDMNRLSDAAIAGKLDTRADATKHLGEYKNIVNGVNRTLDAVIGPLNVAAEYVDRISKGDVPPLIRDEYKGDFNEIKNNLNQCIESIKLLVSDAGMLAKAAVDGKLDIRADAGRHNGDFRAIVDGVNKTLDNVIGPLNVAAEYVDRISKGDIPPRIKDDYKGDFNEIKNNLNQCIDAVNLLVSDAGMLAKAAVDGKLDTRADASRHSGDFRNIVDGVNKTLDNVIGPLNVAAEYVDRIAKGDIPPKITDQYKGDFNEIKNNLNQCIDAINSLVSDAGMLAKAAIDGKLDTRADTNRHNGEFRNIVDGVNKTLDNVIGPLNVAAEYVDRIAKGDIPPKITDQYKGDFNEIKNNLNQCIDAVNALVSDAGMLAKAAVDGKLDIRAEASRHNGEFRAIVEGVNNTLDSVIGPLNVAAEYVDRISKGDIPPKITDQYKGDFNEIKNNLNQCIDAVNLLVSDAGMLASAAIEGKLDTRADSSRHSGDFRGIVDGVNKTLDNVIGPLNVAAEYVDRIAKGDIPPRITDVFKGDFNELKNNLNQAIEAVNLLVSDSGMLVNAALDGKLQTRADASRHQGDFRVIVDGINKTMDAVIEPINDAGQTLAVMATGDLTARMQGTYKGDLANLKENINTFAESLSALILQVGEIVEATASGATQLSSTADTMASSASEQSAQTDEVAGAVEEMSRTITENSNNASQTSIVATKNGEIANEGGKIVEKTVQKMRDIASVVKQSAQNIQELGQSSKQIGEIISVIDDIADQTNLLALNAAIEAARAGEQGRGFAVVADEVRKLAERTTEATKQIAKMITGIQNETEQAVKVMNHGNEEVSSGIELADNAGKSLQEIVQSSRMVLDSINQIAAASEEQSATSEQISHNVLSISKVAGETARQIQDVAKTADDLTRLTEELRNMVSQFVVETKAPTVNRGSRTIASSRTKHLTAGR